MFLTSYQSVIIIQTQIDEDLSKDCHGAGTIEWIGRTLLREVES